MSSPRTIIRERREGGYLNVRHYYISHNTHQTTTNYYRIEENVK